MTHSLLKILASAFFAGMILSACNSSDSVDGSKESFSVKFSLASVPDNLTLDSLEVQIALGDTGKPQNLTIDLKTGTSRAQIMAYPGQEYRLGYKLYASSFEIGAGLDSGTLAKDMKIELKPVWNQGKVESAKRMRELGLLLPAYLETVFDMTLAGKPMVIDLDSSKGRSYSWFIRLGDSTIASGSGSYMSWTPPDSLGGKSVNVKFVVKEGSAIIEERDWDVKVIGSLSTGRLQGVVSKNDTASNLGSFSHFKYNDQGKPDSILTYDTTALVPGRAPVANLAYTYTTAHHPSGDPIKVVRAARNESDIDSIFSYDSKGRLQAITVTLKSGTTVDSIAYPGETVIETRSYAQGKITRTVKSVRISSSEQVDSISSQGDSGMVLSGLIKYELQGGQVVNKRVYRKFGTMVPFESEWSLLNALGSVALRRRYSEGSSLVLEESETWSYKATGLLDRVIIKDEVTGDILQAHYYVYNAVPVTKAAAKLAAGQVDNRRIVQRLADIRRHFPVLPTPFNR